MLALLISLALAATGPTMRAAPVDPEAEMALAPAPEPPDGYRTIEGLYARVHAAPDDRAVAREMAGHAAEALPAIAKRLGVGTGRVVEIVIAEDQEAFRTLQPGEPPSWADGTAWPHRGLIYLRSPRARNGDASPLTQVLDHEIVHVLLGQAFGPRPVPRWLQEGLAQWVAGEAGLDLQKKLSGKRLLSLEDLTGGFPRDPLRAQVAYAQSADLVATIAAEHGEQAISTLVREIARGTPTNAAIRKATGEGADQLESRWRSRLQASVDLAPLAQPESWIALAVPAVLVGWWGRRKRNEERLERWRREEELERSRPHPAIW